MNDFLLFSKRVFICLTLCSTIYSCNKENIEEEMLLGSSTNPSPETTSTSKNYDIFDAMGFKGGMALIYTD